MSTGLKSFFYLNTNLLKLTNMRSNLAGGSIINNATGTAEVLDKDLLPVTNGGPYPITYTISSQGEYTTVFPATIAVPIGRFVNIRVLIDAGVNLVYRGIVEARVVA